MDSIGWKVGGLALLDLHPRMAAITLRVLKVEGTTVAVDSGVWAGMPATGEGGRRVAKLGLSSVEPFLLLGEPAASLEAGRKHLSAAH